MITGDKVYKGLTYAGISAEAACNSLLTRELKLRYPLIAVIPSDNKPDSSVIPRQSGWSCTINLIMLAAKGATVATDRKSIRCPGGKTGMGFGNYYSRHLDTVSSFLSTGKPGRFEGEGYKKTPQLARTMIESIPAIELPCRYLIFKPLDKIDLQSETPELIIFLANPDQLSALIIMANYSRNNNHSVAVSMGSGCSSICLYPFNESKQNEPKAVIGLTDITVRHFLDPDILSFTVPYSMFLKMESDVPGSFLMKGPWKELKKRIMGHR